MKKTLAGQRRISLSFLVTTLLIAAILVSQGCQIRANGEAREALCVIRADRERDLANSKAFLALTVEERVKKYGPELGHIPEAVIKEGIRDDQGVVDALARLDC